MLWDTDIPGFGVRIGKRARTFIVILGSGNRHKLGRYPILSLADARALAKQRLAERTLGADHSRTPLKTLKESFLADIKGEVKERTYEGYEWLLGRIELPSDANRVTARAFTEKVSKLPPSTRSHVTAAYKMLFRYAKRTGYLRHNPVEDFVVRASKARERTLSEAEIKTLWPHLTGTFGNIVKLLIVTGQRRSEIAHITVQGELAHIASDQTKNSRAHLFPIGPLATELLAQPRTWGGWSKSKAALDNKAKLDPWTLHDLRRTFATIHAQLGTPPHLIERLLNHLTGAMTPLSRVYNTHTYIEELKPYVLAYENHLSKLLDAA